jgi:cytidyltransferase-like protein
MTTVAVSGGFDPVHVGHLRMFEAAYAWKGDVVVILNSDEWLMRKKGFVFMPFEERKEILLGFSSVSEVVAVDDSDDTVCEALARIEPDFFGNGGDRKLGNVPELDLCEKLGIEALWNLGGGKVQSSSALTAPGRGRKVKARIVEGGK